MATIIIKRNFFFLSVKLTYDTGRHFNSLANYFNKLFTVKFLSICKLSHEFSYIWQAINLRYCLKKELFV